MAPESACDERYRLGPQEAIAGRPEAVSELPGGLASLLGRAEKLYERVFRLDEQMYVGEQEAPQAANAVLNQFDRLRTAFGS